MVKVFSQEAGQGRQAILLFLTQMKIVLTAEHLATGLQICETECQQVWGMPHRSRYLNPNRRPITLARPTINKGAAERATILSCAFSRSPIIIATGPLCLSPLHMAGCPVPAVVICWVHAMDLEDHMLSLWSAEEWRLACRRLKKEPTYKQCDGISAHDWKVVSMNPLAGRLIISPFSKAFNRNGCDNKVRREVEHVAPFLVVWDTFGFLP